MCLIQSVRPDLINALLQEADKVMYTDGSSFIQNEIRYAGAVVIIQDKTI